MARIVGPDGQVAEVDDENRLKTFAVSQREDKHLNEEGKVWSVYFNVTPVGANDYFFYLKNNGVLDLKITDIRISSSSPTTIFYESVRGAPVFVAEQDAQVTSRLLGNARTPTADLKFDTDITGLTPEGVLFFEECAVADTRYKLSSTSNILIPQGQAIAFRREAAAGAIEALISVVESE